MDENTCGRSFKRSSGRPEKIQRTKRPFCALRRRFPLQQRSWVPGWCEDQLRAAEVRAQDAEGARACVARAALVGICGAAESWADKVPRRRRGKGGYRVLHGMQMAPASQLGRFGKFFLQHSVKLRRAKSARQRSLIVQHDALQ
eukprot:scaffold1147_cov250-Pinguiococcus_pyrenoidosus.AAC.12